MRRATDRELIDEALRHWREMFGYALALTGDAASAEDHCQEAIVRLATAARAVDRSTSVRPLLLRAVRNLVIDDRRRRRCDSLDDLAKDALDAVADREREPLPEASRRELAALVREALDRLPARWRAILFLRDALGLSYGEVAKVEGTSEDVVRVTLHRARRRIRASLRHHVHLEEEGR